MAVSTIPTIGTAKYSPLSVSGHTLTFGLEQLDVDESKNALVESCIDDGYGKCFVSVPDACIENIAMEADVVPDDEDDAVVVAKLSKVDGIAVASDTDVDVTNGLVVVVVAVAIAVVAVEEKEEEVVPAVVPNGSGVSSGATATPCSPTLAGTGASKGLAVKGVDAAKRTSGYVVVVVVVNAAALYVSVPAPAVIGVASNSPVPVLSFPSSTGSAVAGDGAKCGHTT